MKTPWCRHVYACHVRTVKLQPFTRRDTPTTLTGASTIIDSAPRWGGLYWQDCGCPASVHQGRQHGRRHTVQTAGILRDWGRPMNLLRWFGERSEERRVGKECVSTCTSRGSPCHQKNNKKPEYSKDKLTNLQIQCKAQPYHTIA